jgi:putative tricarboxylic transport membrane protein
VSLLIGLLISCVGLENPAGAPRYTLGNAELAGGISLIPLMIGMFAISEVLRFAVVVDKPVMAVDRPFGNVFTGMWALLKKYPLQLFRGSALGTLVGALPGAGADIAAWMSYGVSKRFSKEPEKFGTGHVEGIVESGAANNSALGGAWIPALVFGIPGDSITAIAIGVLYLKNMNPGPTLFVDNPQNIYAVFIVFILAQLLMLPFGWMAIKVAKQILRIPAAPADAADPAVLHRRQLRHQQLDVRRHRDGRGRCRRPSSWSAGASRWRPPSWAWCWAPCSRSISSAA